MKILHVCLANFYIDHCGYQENILPRMNKDDGHEVKILASTETYVDGRFAYVEPNTYFNEDGIEVTRLPYRRFAPHALMKKLRYYKGVSAYLDEFAPDAILYHGNGGHGIVEVLGYVKSHPEVLFYVDSHESFGNSGKNWLSKNVLHRVFGRYCYQRAAPYVKKLLCIAPECYPFLEELYGVEREDMELFPLGGVILSEKDYHELRAKKRVDLGYSDTDLVFLHSGKLSEAKRTEVLLRVWEEGGLPECCKLLISGVAHGEVLACIESALKKDPRIRYLGWADAKDLKSLMCAADVYLQPGTPSASLQEAMCSHCAVAVRKGTGYYELFSDSIWYVDSAEDVADLIFHIANDGGFLERFQGSAFDVAGRMLDYKVLARRFLSQGAS